MITMQLPADNMEQVMVCERTGGIISELESLKYMTKD
jgi:hypothetical protein